MNISINILSKLLFILFLIIIPVNTISQTIEKQTSEISNELLCPVCRGQTVGESNSDLAKDFRDIIKTKLKEGKSKEEIIQYFRDRYGDSVLASPPAKGFRLIIWILPIVVILFGFILFGKFLRSESIKKQNKSYESENDKYLKEVDKELDNDD